MIDFKDEYNSYEELASECIIGNTYEKYGICSGYYYDGKKWFPCWKQDSQNIDWHKTAIGSRIDAGFWD